MFYTILWMIFAYCFMSYLFQTWSDDLDADVPDTDSDLQGQPHCPPHPTEVAGEGGDSEATCGVRCSVRLVI